MRKLAIGLGCLVAIGLLVSGCAQSQVGRGQERATGWSVIESTQRSGSRFVIDTYVSVSDGGIAWVQVNCTNATTATVVVAPEQAFSIISLTDSQSHAVVATASVMLEGDNYGGELPKARNPLALEPGQLLDGVAKLQLPARGTFTLVAILPRLDGLKSEATTISSR